MATTNQDHHDLTDALYGGLVRESVLNELFDISTNVKPDFTQLIGKSTHKSMYFEWTKDKLADPLLTNKYIDGQDVDEDHSNLGDRVGNHSQTSTKSVQISDLSEAADSIANIGKMVKQISRRQMELRRDVEAQMLSSQPSIKGDSSTAHQSAGFGAWLTTNVNHGATGSAGGFNTATGIVDAPTMGTARGLTKAMVDDMMEQIYIAGGNCNVLMGPPKIIGMLERFFFETGAQVAVQTNEFSNPTTGVKAIGGTTHYIGQHDQVVRLVSNRLMPEESAGIQSLYFIDPSKVKQSIMRGYQVEPLAKTGLAKKRLMSVTYGLAVTCEEAHGAIYSIDTSVAITAS